jgi:hypothetical protein
MGPSALHQSSGHSKRPAIFDLLSGDAANASSRSHKLRATRVLLGEERITLLGGQKKRIHLLLSATGGRLIRKLKRTTTLELVEERKDGDGKVVMTTTKIKVAHHRRRSTNSHKA